MISKYDGFSYGCVACADAPTAFTGLHLGIFLLTMKTIFDVPSVPGESSREEVVLIQFVKFCCEILQANSKDFSQIMLAQTAKSKSLRSRFT